MAKQPKSNKEFMKSSEFFNYLYEDLKNDLKKDMQQVDDTKDYVRWIQNFSKKIVAILAILYIAINVFIMYIMYSQTKTVSVSEFSGIYTEINETFRVVIGGYLIKAGLENAFKIGGGYISGIADSKLDVFKTKLGLQTQQSSNEEFESDEFINSSDDDIVA